ncbi:matrixin family metalloprotease [Heliobacterium gestii]|uniref:Matrixin family metalloprotease n=1 Tax=Heliomicrobium gestii TaxID=2699 RepID=A0A845LAT0_HELGE|nr:matrixin family metalloprotease [Heliomicrobium gestii]MBM7868527.1 hypothetical protein [Heliomicrobium gestii]MZP42414.1 matrixin family metalloprotease [Heliomicrobium gestii]
MIKFSIKKALLGVALTVFCMGITGVAFAYNLMGYVWSNPKGLGYYFASGTPSDIQTAASEGANAWNNASSLIYIGAGGSKNVYIKTVSQSGSAFSGMTDLKLGWDSKISSAAITINTAAISNYTSLEKKGTLAHEIGHAFGLGESGDLWALMYPYDSERIYRGTYVPRDDDKQGIDAMY